MKLPSDSDGEFRTNKRGAAVDRASSLLRAVRDRLLSLWPTRDSGNS